MRPRCKNTGISGELLKALLIDMDQGLQTCSMLQLKTEVPPEYLLMPSSHRPLITIRRTTYNTSNRASVHNQRDSSTQELRVAS